MSPHWLDQDVVGRIHKDGKLVAVRLSSGETVSVRAVNPLPAPNESSKDSVRHSAESTQPRNIDMSEKQATTRTLKPFNLPKAAEQKMPTEGSKRRIAYDLISRDSGATLEEVQSATGWNRRNTVEGIRLLSKHNGYGLKQTEDGSIHLA